MFLLAFVTIPVYADTPDESISILNLRLNDAQNNLIDEIIVDQEVHFKFELYNHLDHPQEVVSIFYRLHDYKKEKIGSTLDTIYPSSKSTGLDYSFSANSEGLHTFAIEIWDKDETSQITTVLLGPITAYDVENREVILKPIFSKHLLTIGEGSSNGQFVNLSDFAVDKDGYVFAVDDVRNEIQKFDPHGNFLLKWGSFCYFEYEYDDCTDPDGVMGPLKRGDGQFYSPSHIAVDDEQVYVVDRKNHRMQVFDKDGQFLYTFGNPFGYIQSVGGNSFTHSRDVEIVDDRIYLSDLGGVAIFEKDGSILYHADRTSKEHVVFNKPLKHFNRLIGKKVCHG